MPSERSGARRNRRLSAWRIVMWILESASSSPKSPFQLQREIVVSRSTLTRYSRILLDEGLIEEIEGEGGKLLLRTTPRGIQAYKRRRESFAYSPPEAEADWEKFFLET